MATATVPRETKPTALLELRSIPLRLIAVGPNVRADVGELEELAASIAHSGVLQPIRVVPNGDGTYKLIFGQRRLAAAKLAGLTEIPALVSLVDVARAHTYSQLVENLQRQDLGPLEEARAFHQLLEADKDLTQAELARRIGRSAPYVSNALRILELDPKVQKLVADGTLSGSHAKAIASLPPDEGIQLATDAQRYGWSVHELENQVAWRTRRAEDEAQAGQKAEKRALSTIGWLRTHKVPTDAVLFIDSNQHPALTKAGWKNLRDRYSSHSSFRPGEVKGCDCTAWVYEYDGKWQRCCASMKHRRAFLADEKLADLERRKDGLEKLAAGRQLVQVAIAEMDSPFEHRLLLWSVLREGYNHSDFARGLGKRLLGKELTMSSDSDLLWQMVVELPDDQVRVVLGEAVAEKVLPDLTRDAGEWSGRSHQTIRRAVIVELGADPQLVDGKKPAPARKGGKA